MQKTEKDVSKTQTQNFDSCIGCNLYDSEKNRCYEFGNIIEFCPCRTCLIKTICRTHCYDALIMVGKQKSEHIVITH